MQPGVNLISFLTARSNFFYCPNVIHTENMKIHSNAVGGRNTVKAHADVDIFRVGDVPDD